MSVTVLVPGYGGRLRAVDRWRMTVAVNTLASHGGGRLVVSGHGGEAERLAALAPRGTDVVLESTARSTLENVERSLPFLVDAELVAIASICVTDAESPGIYGAFIPSCWSAWSSRCIGGVRDGGWMLAAPCTCRCSLFAGHPGGCETGAAVQLVGSMKSPLDDPT